MSPLHERSSAALRMCQERSGSFEEKLNFIWGEGGEGLSEMKLTIEEGPNGPMKETSRGTEVRGREGGYIGGW